LKDTSLNVKGMRTKNVSCLMFVIVITLLQVKYLLRQKFVHFKVFGLTCHNSIIQEMYNR
jgi:hypothetical protein